MTTLNIEPKGNRTPAEAQMLEDAAKLLEASGLFQVLRRFQAKDVFNEDDGAPKKTLMVVDTETTGTDFQKDKVFEIGYVLVEFSPETGKLYKVLDRHTDLEDPGFPLPALIEKITGVTYDQVEGKIFNRAKINADIGRADLVIAQNAGFDRKFLEPEFPAFKALPWVCSVVQGPWEEMTIGTKKQEYLAWKVAGIFYEAHRALTDAEALLEIISREGPQDKSIFKHILDVGTEASFTVWANNSPYEAKDTLKLERGYRWSDGTELGKLKSWYKEGVVDPDAEVAYLAENIYPRAAKINIDMILPEDAFSTRYTERQEVPVTPARNSSPRL